MRVEAADAVSPSRGRPLRQQVAVDHALGVGRLLVHVGGQGACEISNRKPLPEGLQDLLALDAPWSVAVPHRSRHTAHAQLRAHRLEVGGGDVRGLSAGAVVSHACCARVQRVHHGLQSQGLEGVHKSQHLIGEAGVAAAELAVQGVDGAALLSLAALVGLGQALQRCRAASRRPSGSRPEDVPEGPHSVPLHHWVAGVDGQPLAVGHPDVVCHRRAPCAVQNERHIGHVCL
mmetsp:Transcript_34660/g.107854  ORF Transcript_34660/g.107854 Transcript_34660/m.107854 type:complete len:232 (+) Transcript_34660:631-1326(+)